MRFVNFRFKLINSYKPMMRVLTKFLSVLIVALVMAQSSQASLITIDPGTGATTTFTATGNTGYNIPGPAVINGISWTGSPQVQYGNNTYYLGTNGFWNMSWVGTNGRGSITANLGGNYGFVGGFVNYSPGLGGLPTDAIVQALAADGHTVLESYDLETLHLINTPHAVNGGAFIGIERTENDIAYFRLAGDFILTHSIEIGASDVPEPTSLALVGIALCGIGAVRRKRA